MNREPRHWRGLALALVVACLAAPSPALTHGGQKHAMGTVKEMTADHLVIETRQGKIQTVPVSQDTVYEQKGAKAPGGDLRVGDRVVVHFTKAGVAKLIRFARPKGGEKPREVSPSP